MPLLFAGARTFSESTSSDSNSNTESSSHGEVSALSPVVVFAEIALLMSAFIAMLLLSKRPIRYLPQSAAILVVGILGGFLINISAWSNVLVRFEPHLFFTLLLPPIIFESGWNMKKFLFFNNVGTILMFAATGTLISTVVVGCAIWLLGMVGLVATLTAAQSFVYASLISAIDPVATLAILSESSVDPNLFMIVFGESVINDAVAVVLYRVFFRFFTDPLTIGALGKMLLDFFVIFTGSFIVGLGVALLTALFFKHAKLTEPILETLMMFANSYLPFLLAESVGFSGIVAILFAGMANKHYTYHNLSAEGQHYSEFIFRMMAVLAETVVFLELGLNVFTLGEKYYLDLIFWSLIIVLLARAANIFPLAWLLNTKRKTPITRNEQIMMWFSGLRGAIAFALSMETPVEQNQSKIVGTTMMVVVITTFAFGGGTGSMLDYLQLAQDDSTKQNKLIPDEAPLAHFETVGRFLTIDAKYLMPFFTRSSPPAIVRDANLDAILSKPEIAAEIQTSNYSAFPDEDDRKGEHHHGHDNMHVQVRH